MRGGNYTNRDIIDLEQSFLRREGYGIGFLTSEVNSYVGCTNHPEIFPLKGKGKLTGGKNKTQKDTADLYIALNDYENPIDSFGKLRFTKQRVITFFFADGGTPLDTNKLTTILNVVHEYIIKGKHVHIHCIGGHGRTGTIIACYIGKYTNIENPIEWVRENYCEKAIETTKQHNFIVSYTGKGTKKEEPHFTFYGSVIRKDIIKHAVELLIVLRPDIIYDEFYTVKDDDKLTFTNRILKINDEKFWRTMSRAEELEALDKFLKFLKKEKEGKEVIINTEVIDVNVVE
jgi:hypothetical protein